MAKNVLQKAWNGSSWDELHPITMASNVIYSSGFSIADYLAGLVFNVKAYGAKGDGVTDDTTAIQAAIDACAAAGGGVVFFPRGVYNIMSGLTIKAKVNLAGISARESIIRWNSNSNGTMLNTTNVPMNGAYIGKLQFAKRLDSPALVTGILGGSTLANYNSAIIHFEDLIFNSLQYGMRGNAEPTGVGIFDSTFINVWAAHCTYGFWLHGSGNTFINPRITLCDIGLALDYLNGESYGSAKVFGGVFVQNGYDIGVLNANGSRDSGFFGTWFEQATNGILTLPNANTKVQAMKFDNCTLSADSTVDLFNAVNALGTITIDACNIVQTAPAHAKNIVRPTSGASRLTVRNTNVINHDGSRSVMDDNDANGKSAVHAFPTTTQTIPAASFVTFLCDTEVYDNRNEFNLATDIFTAQEAGLYQVNASIRLASQPAGNRALLAIYKNGVSELVLYDAAGATGVSALSGSGIIKLDKGDYIDLRIYSTSSVTTASPTAYNTHYIQVTKLSS